MEWVRQTLTDNTDWQYYKAGVLDSLVVWSLASGFLCVPESVLLNISYPMPSSDYDLRVLDRHLLNEGNFDFVK